MFEALKLFQKSCTLSLVHNSKFYICLQVYEKGMKKQFLLSLCRLGLAVHFAKFVMKQHVQDQQVIS